jgi:hypothetical protein
LCPSNQRNFIVNIYPERKLVRMYQFRFLVLLLASLLIASTAADQPTVYIIRHGEKSGDPEDSGLNADGFRRAQCLRDVFGVNSIYDIGHIIVPRPNRCMPKSLLTLPCDSIRLCRSNSLLSRRWSTQTPIRDRAPARYRLRSSSWSLVQTESSQMRSKTREELPGTRKYPDFLATRENERNCGGTGLWTCPGISSGSVSRAGPFRAWILADSEQLRFDLDCAFSLWQRHGCQERRMSWSWYSVITQGSRLTSVGSTWLEQEDDAMFRLGRTFIGVGWRLDRYRHNKRVDRYRHNKRVLGISIFIYHHLGNMWLDGQATA